MRALAEGLQKDNALGAELSKRGNQLIGGQCTQEWSPGTGGHSAPLQLAR
ncbi:hypothetical protein ABIC78_004293 [Novosphingobium sp. 1529]